MIWINYLPGNFHSTTLDFGILLLRYLLAFDTLKKKKTLLHFKHLFWIFIYLLYKSKWTKLCVPLLSDRLKCHNKCTKEAPPCHLLIYHRGGKKLFRDISIFLLIKSLIPSVLNAYRYVFKKQQRSLCFQTRSFMFH